MRKLAGVLVEPRDDSAILPLIENFFSVVDLDCVLYFFHGKGLHESRLRIIRARYGSRVILIKLDVSTLSYSQHSDLYKSERFWRYVEAEFALNIQIDGCLCTRSNYRVDDFFCYDFVGGFASEAWWSKEVGDLISADALQCFNGGFSLRNVRAQIDAIRRFPPKPTQIFRPGVTPEEFGEDLYFVYTFIKLGYKVGMDELATKFCSHTSYSVGSFAVHRTARYPSRSTIVENDFLSYCPEYLSFI